MAKLDAGPGAPKQEVQHIKVPEGYQLVDWNELGVGDIILGIRRPIYEEDEAVDKTGHILTFTWKGRVHAVDRDNDIVTIGTIDNRVIPIKDAGKAYFFRQN